LIKREIFIIIYIESEREIKKNCSTFRRDSEINNLKSSENLAIIYIESEREK